MPASQAPVSTTIGPLRGRAAAGSGAVTAAGTVLSAGLLMAGSVSWGSVVTVGVPLLRTMSAGTYSTVLVRWVRSWTGAPTAPIRDTAEVTDTGHISRNSTTAHRA